MYAEHTEEAEAAAVEAVKPAWYDNPDTKIEAATALAALGFVMAFIAIVLGRGLHSSPSQLNLSRF